MELFASTGQGTLQVQNARVFETLSGFWNVDVHDKLRRCNSISDYLCIAFVVRVSRCLTSHNNMTCLSDVRLLSRVHTLTGIRQIG
jgi:hypothetical protein